jgi:hypothetical protein
MPKNRLRKDAFPILVRLLDGPNEGKEMVFNNAYEIPARRSYQIIQTHYHQDSVSFKDRQFKD